MRKLFFALLLLWLQPGAVYAQTTSIDWRVKPESSSAASLSDGFPASSGTQGHIWLNLDHAFLFSRGSQATVSPFFEYTSLDYGSARYDTFIPGVRYARGNFSIEAIASSTKFSVNPLSPKIKDSGDAINYALPNGFYVQGIRRNDTTLAIGLKTYF